MKMIKFTKRLGETDIAFLTRALEEAYARNLHQLAKLSANIYMSPRMCAWVNAHLGNFMPTTIHRFIKDESVGNTVIFVEIDA